VSFVGPCGGVIRRTIREKFQSHSDWTSYRKDTRVEAGSNTSTVTLRVVGGGEKGSLKSESVKYGHES
jgi:hypothetical protein